MFKKIKKFFKKSRKPKRLNPHGKILAWESASDELFIDLLKNIMEDDIKRYFHASTEEERQRVRGAYLRNKYLVSQLEKFDKEKVSKKVREIVSEGRLNIPRYDNSSK